MSNAIHPTAIIDPHAEIGQNVAIGPFTLVGPNAHLGDDVTLRERVSVDWCRIGRGSSVGAGSRIGGNPQIYNWSSVMSHVVIGENVFVNELCAIHRSMYDGGETRIGDDCYIMTQTHIGHDCHLGREVTLTSLAGLSGHVVVEDFAVIGGGAGVHQFVRVGAMAMIGGMARIVQDVIPYFMVEGSPAHARGLNSYALKKREMSSASRSGIKKAYHILNPRKNRPPLSEAVARMEAELSAIPEVGAIIAFVRKSKRGVTL